LDPAARSLIDDLVGSVERLGLPRGLSLHILGELQTMLSSEEWADIQVLLADAHKRGRAARQHNKELADERQRLAAVKRELARQEAELREAEEARQRELARQAEEARRARQQSVIHRVRRALSADYLTADEALARDPDSELLTTMEFDALKVEFVRKWFEREIRKPLGAQPLDYEQAAAVAATQGDIHVEARAGSGKTTALVARASFLQKHCRVPPQSLLLLAFNRDAAANMLERLRRVLGASLPHVMTFHALANRLVRPEEQLVFDQREQRGQTREIEGAVRQLLLQGTLWGTVRDLMLLHFREDWSRLVANDSGLTKDELLAFRRALVQESLKGDYVKSFGEKVIANALFEHDIEYQYERNRRWNGHNYRPDFTIETAADRGVIIEYFGLAGDDSYEESMQAKREYWADQDDWTFLEFRPEDITLGGPDAFVAVLLQKLEEAGVEWRVLSEDAIWKRIKNRAESRFVRAMATFIVRCRKANLSVEGLRQRIKAHHAISESEKLFLDVGLDVYPRYCEALKAQRKEDFDGLFWRAVEQVRRGETQFARNADDQGNLRDIRFVMVDEFQDFSEMFFELLAAMRLHNPSAQLFCVGDNWQAINSFAGSDLRFFTDFAHYFPGSSFRQIRTNHRSAKGIVEASNSLMNGLGSPSQAHRSDAGDVWLCKLDEFNPVGTERALHAGDEITPAVLRVISHFLKLTPDCRVVLLARRNGLPWFVRYDKGIDRAGDELTRFLQHVQS
jgi:DNA helicase-4